MRTRVVPILLLGLLGSSACAPFGDDGATKAAQALAVALEHHNVSGVRFTDASGAKAIQPLLDPLARYSSRVEVRHVNTHGRRASATLHWATDLGPGTWEHDVPVLLRKVGDRWEVQPRTSLVAPEIGKGDKLSIATEKAPRGRILGAHGSVLVEPRPVLRIGLDKTQVPPARVETSARELARALKLDPDKLVKAAKAAGPKAFVEALTVRGDGPQAVTPGDWHGIVGAVGLADHRPLAPTREFARQILGVVGPVNAEVRKLAKGRLAPGDDAGLSGLQLRYDELLGGRSGRVVSVIKPGGEHQVLFHIASKAGSDLTTTLDPRLQQQADDLLQHTATASALVAIKPSTGEILAAASGPAGNGYDTATFGRYAPGSTFKIVSSLALLRAGLTPTSTVTCPPRTTVDGKEFKNYSDYPAGHYGSIPLEDAVANSCNTAFITARDKVKGDALAKAAAALGLGVDHDLGFPAFFGDVPAARSETEAAADLIGQGRVTASPMAMATVLASVLAQHTVVPWLLPSSRPTASNALTPGEAEALHTLLHKVVTDGSGRGLLGLADVAKTGTAEFGDATRTHAWMVGGKGDLAVAVFVDQGESGSKTAGPILKSFLQAALSR